MKKLLLMSALMLSSMVAMAQVAFFNGNLKEAIAKAKAENKPVIVLGSATW